MSGSVDDTITDEEMGWYQDREVRGIRYHGDQWTGTQASVYLGKRSKVADSSQQNISNRIIPLQLHWQATSVKIT
jgi:hypothetical protein